jgi:hypothetical protein
MKVDPEKPVTALVTLENFVLDVGPIGGLGTYQDDCGRGAIELTIDPRLDCFSALTFNCFKLGFIDEASRFTVSRDKPGVANLIDAPDIVVMEAKENPSSHVLTPRAIRRSVLVVQRDSRARSTVGTLFEIARVQRNMTGGCADRE